MIWSAHEVVVAEHVQHRCPACGGSDGVSVVGRKKVLASTRIPYRWLICACGWDERVGVVTLRDLPTH